MSIEAIFVIGAFILILGTILLVPGLWWAKRKSSQIPEDAPGAKRVTLFGFAFFSVFVGLIFLVLSLEYIAPDISGAHRSIVFIAVLLLGVFGEKLANKLGYKLVVKNEKRV